jgi:protein TonB
VKIPEGVFPARLISQPQPVYPREARRKRIEGDVVLHAIIDTMGNIAKLSVISGDPLLVDAAEDAVSKWKYAPTLVNGVPREVETTITVKFELGEKPKGQKPN